MFRVIEWSPTAESFLLYVCLAFSSVSTLAHGQPTPAVEDSPSLRLVDDHDRQVRTVRNLLIVGYVILGLFVLLVCRATNKSKPDDYEPMRRWQYRNVWRNARGKPVHRLVDRVSLRIDGPMVKRPKEDRRCEINEFAENYDILSCFVRIL